MKKKFCVFCGENPVSKTAEHVIPRWLIKLTGDPNRPVSLGFRWNNNSLEKVKHSFDEFHFPACHKCNQDYSDLESQAKEIVTFILAKAPITETDWHNFLNWLDKVRIGLWLGQHYMTRQQIEIDPKFYISQRTGQCDRMLVIYESDDVDFTHLSWCGTQFPIFHFMPSCFKLTINNFSFLSVSKEYLFSKEIGFPYPSSIIQGDAGSIFVQMVEGSKIMTTPLINYKFKTGGTQLFQPMITTRNKHVKPFFGNDFNQLYDNDYINRMMIDSESGIGKIWKRERNGYIEYPKDPSRVWIPKQRFEKTTLFKNLSISVGELLAMLYSQKSIFDDLDKDIIERTQNEKTCISTAHNEILSKMIKLN